MTRVLVVWEDAHCESLGDLVKRAVSVHGTPGAVTRPTIWSLHQGEPEPPEPPKPEAAPKREAAPATRPAREPRTQKPQRTQSATPKKRKRA